MIEDNVSHGAGSYRRLIRSQGGVRKIGPVNTRSLAEVVDVSAASAVQAAPGPFWRDRGFWVQVIAQSALFLLFGGMDIGIALSNGVFFSSLLMISGYVAAFFGLLIQRHYPEPGVAVVAVGLVMAGASVGQIFALGVGIVCYEAWFMSGYLQRHRTTWLICLVSGALLTLVATTTGPTTGVRWGTPLTEDPDYDASARELWLLVGVLGILVLVSIALCWQLGMGVRRQHERMEKLAARAELAAVVERNRIAREMHDIVAHSLTAVIAQADGGRYAGISQPEKAIDALDAISATGREALVQMRQLLSVLREDEGRDSSTAPGMNGIAGLVEDAERSGLVVSLQVRGEAHEVPPTVGLSVYRTVQEALTNVLKHAGKVDTQVVLDWTHSGELHITVDNAAGQGLVDAESAAGGEGGQGLVGLGERAKVHGGQAQWGPSPVYFGGWRVEVMVSL